jgi:hypothetical protein
VSQLHEILARCKCGVYLTVNQHRDNYESATDYLKSRASYSDECADTPADIVAKMIETDTIIELQFYPDTSIGCYILFHHDLDAAICEGVRILAEHDRTRARPLAGASTP